MLYCKKLKDLPELVEHYYTINHAYPRYVYLPDRYFEEVITSIGPVIKLCLLKNNTHTCKEIVESTEQDYREVYLTPLKVDGTLISVGSFDGLPNNLV